MPAGVLPLSERLRSDFRFLRSLSVSQMVIGLLTLPAVLILGTLQTAVAVALILAYGAAKVLRFRDSDRALKQLRLEERFFRQHLDENTLRDCLRRSEHLWDESQTLRALRGVQSISLPSLLSRREKIGLVQRKYHATFRSMIPSRIAPEALIPAAGFVILVSGVLTAGSLWITMFGTGIVGALLMEAARLQRVLTVRRRFDGYERALSEWTLGQPFLFRSDTTTRRPYRHQLLYRTEPLFNIRRAVHMRKARF